MKAPATARRCCSTAFGPTAEVFKALGHPTRVMAVAAIGRKERCVQELTELAGCDMSTMSNHLAVLKSAGVLAAERRASQVFYRVARPCVLDFVRCLTGD